MANVVAFRRIGGRIIPILKRAAGDVKNIKHAFAALPKKPDIAKAGRVLAKIDGGISGSKKFLADMPDLSQNTVGALRKSIARRRDIYFKVKNGTEDALEIFNSAKRLRQSGRRGVNILAGLGLAASSASLVSSKKPKTGA